MSQKVKKQFFRILPWSVVGLMVITLLVGVSVNLSSSVLAADTISSATYIDADGDGSVDHIKITFDTNITQCDYEGGDWGVNTAGDFNISITGIDTGDPEGTGEGACDGSDAIVYVSVSADASETGSSADPDISYTDQGSLGDLMDSAAITDKNNIVATDAAAPVVINTIDYYSSGSDGTVDSFDVYYSENVTFNGADLTQFAIVNQGLTGFDSDGNPDAVSGSGTSTLTFTTSGTTWLTGVLATTNVEPTLAYTQGVAANRVQDSVLIPNYAANFGATSMYDYAQPVLDASSAGNLEYYNYNSTGPADAVSFYFTEPVDYIYNDADWLVTANALTGLDVTKCLEAGDGYYNGCVAATANGWVELLAAGTTSLTGISGDVLGEPDVTYSGGGIMDTNLNSAPGFGPLPLTDYAQPYPVSAGYVDNNGDGQIDGAGIQFSENVTYTYLGTDWSASTAGEITNFALTGVDLITCPLGVCTNINLVPFTATADADITGAPTGNNPDLDYVLGNAISDTSAATNGATNFNLADIDDLAAPVVTDTYYEDSDSNGTVDRITMDMTVDEGLTCNFAVGDYALTAGDILNDTTPTGCSVSGNEIYIDVNGESNVTGGATDPTIAFTNFANVYDNSTNNNNVNDFGPLSASDGARPFIWAVETDDSDGNGMIDTINISTSEDLNDDFGDITATVGAYTVSS
ncbi:MAG: hypothetical protein NTX82_05470, partial [Candidatus Parcubacteria bacterium]|nr:hypothetical protein [Candidatus Parcubacteria bacterium]